MKKEFELSKKIILVEGDNSKWYTRNFEDMMDYSGYGFKTLKGAITTMRNQGNEVVLIVDKNKKKIAGEKLR